MPPTDGGNPHLRRGTDATRLIAGLAEFGLEQAAGLLRRMHGAARRNDYADLAADAHNDLLARGNVMLARLGPGPEAHMEALARIARQNRGMTGDA